MTGTLSPHKKKKIKKSHTRLWLFSDVEHTTLPGSSICQSNVFYVNVFSAIQTWQDICRKEPQRSHYDKKEDFFVLSQAALLMDFKSYFAVEAQINDHRECDGRSSRLFAVDPLSIVDSHQYAEEILLIVLRYSTMHKHRGCTTC